MTPSTFPLSLILLYHRVAALDADPFGLAVTPEHFAQHMAVVAEVGALTLDAAAALTHAPRSPSRGVAVTFDDGYRDNLVHALPALAAVNVPATVYVTTGPTGTTKAFWWDELAALILEAPPTAGPLTVTAGRRTVALQGRSPEAIVGLWRAIRCLEAPEHDTAMTHIRTWAGRTTPLDYDEDQRVMSQEELREMADHPLMTLGAHTVTHPVLACLSSADQRREITESRRQLEAFIDRQVTSFAYPFGRPRIDHTRESAQLVADAGYTSACAVLDRELTQRSPTLALPRWAPPNVDGEQFRAMLLARLRPQSPASRVRRVARERVLALAER